MSIYCPVCGTLKSNPNHKTCGNQSCRSTLGWSDHRKEHHRKLFNPSISTGRPKGSKNKNPYPETEEVLARYKQDSINKKQKYNNMTVEERKAYYGTNFGSSVEVQNRCRAIATENVLKQGTSKKGKYTPNNPSKYLGDPTNIIYRSLWEKKVMEYLDDNLSIVKWSSEEIIIPYFSPVDKKYHRYYPDFYMQAKNPDGTIKHMILEVKPYAQTQEPKIPKRKTKRFITEVMTYGVNQAKWKAAQDYCLHKGWDFQILTENEIFAGKKSK